MVKKYARHAWTLLAALAWLVYFTVTLAVPIAGDDPPLVIRATAILVGIILLLAVLFAGERTAWSTRSRVIVFAVGLGLVLAGYFFNLHEPAYRGVLALGLMGLALPIGYWVGNQLEKVTNLVPVAVAFTFADIYSVFQGPSSKAVEDIQDFDENKAAAVQAIAEATSADAAAAAREAAASLRAPLADYVVVQFPVPGTGSTVSVLGIGDFVIMALLFRAAWVHGINPVGVLVSGMVSIFVALVTSGILGVAIPALPFIAVGVVGYLLVTNPRLRKVDRQEIVLSVIVAAVFIGLMAVRYFQAVASGS